MPNCLGQFRRAIAAIFGTMGQRIINLSPKLPRDFGKRGGFGFGDHQRGSRIRGGHRQVARISKLWQVQF
jgi:hypothetical protein